MANVSPHKHCLICGNALDGDESFCDELCESKYKSAQRRQQVLFIVFLALFVLILALPTLLDIKV